MRFLLHIDRRRRFGVRPGQQRLPVTGDRRPAAATDISPVAADGPRPGESASDDIDGTPLVGRWSHGCITYYNVAYWKC